MYDVRKLRDAIQGEVEIYLYVCKAHDQCTKRNLVVSKDSDTTFLRQFEIQRFGNNVTALLFTFSICSKFNKFHIAFLPRIVECQLS